MAHAANVPQADIMITLGAVIIDAGVQFFANNTKLSAEDAGVMITRGVRTYRRSKEPAEFGPSGSP